MPPAASSFTLAFAPLPAMCSLRRCRIDRCGLFGVSNLFFSTPGNSFYVAERAGPNSPVPDGEGDCVSATKRNKALSGIFINVNTLNTFVNANGLANGADLSPVMQLMQTQGFSQDGNTYLDGGIGPLAVNYADQSTLTSAIYDAAHDGVGISLGGV